ncbi:MAG TPA: arylsulfotransferase family protein [Acidimicrobiales bacterium]|nr:arylsulfotransferase family protein [Acidimicrobiales bacterium]
MSRRDLLRFGGGLALGGGLSSLVGCGSRSGGGAKATLAPATGDVQSFEAYPGLHPAVVKIGLNRDGQSSGVILIDSHFGPGQQGPMILDRDGQLVWFRKVSDSGAALRAFNLRAETYLGQPVLTWYEGPVVSGHGQGHYEIVDATYSTVAVVEAGNGYQGDLHEFFLTPDGTAFFTCYGTGFADLSSLGGGKHAPYFYGVAQEVDVKTGKVLFQWRSDEHVAFAESYAPLPKDSGTPWDYFHINSISLSGSEDLLISSRHTWTVYKVSRRTGAVLSRMGGKKSDFKFGPGAAYAWQHDVTQQADGRVTVFDNGTGLYVTQPGSRGLLLAVDEAKGTVDLVRAYSHPDFALRAGALGSVQLLPDGHVFVGWGVHAWYTEFRADGTALLDGNLAGSATQSYRAFRSPWTGRPAAPPGVAVKLTGDGMTVFAAWNGATEVAHWAVLAGKDRSRLQRAKVAVKDGFETAIPVPDRMPYLAVAALDASGRQLGLSPTITT